MAMSTWREGGGEWGEKGQRGKSREKEKSKRKRVRRGASSSFYSESGTPGCCQVTVGHSLDRMPALVPFTG